MIYIGLNIEFLLYTLKEHRYTIVEFQTLKTINRSMFYDFNEREQKLKTGFASHNLYLALFIFLQLYVNFMEIFMDCFGTECGSR